MGESNGPSKPEIFWLWVRRVFILAVTGGVVILGGHLTYIAFHKEKPDPWSLAVAGIILLVTMMFFAMAVKTTIAGPQSNGAGAAVNGMDWGKVLPFLKPVGLWGLLVVALGLVILGAYSTIGGFRDQLGLPALALAGILLLLGALLIFSIAMNAVELSDKTQALGLPEGSVRAIIALSLVGFFAIMAASVLHGTDKRVVPNPVNETEADEILRKNPDAMNVLRTPDPIPAGVTKFKLSFEVPHKVDEYGKQILTLVGTLMTAVIAFYFGSSPRLPTDVSRAAPVLLAVRDSVRPPTSGSLNLILTGESLNSIRKVRLSRAGIELEAVQVLSNASEVNCSFAPNGALGQSGTWDVTITDDIGRSVSKAGGLTLAKVVLTKVDPTTCSIEDAKNKGFTVTGTGLDDTKTTVQLVDKTGGKPVLNGVILPGRTATSLRCTFAEATDGKWTLQVLTGGADAPVSAAGEITIE